MKASRSSVPGTTPARAPSRYSVLDRVRLRHVDSSHYNRTRAELGWARGRVGGSAPPVQVMEEELSLRAPQPGEGRQSKPDAYINKTIQPDALDQLPPQFQVSELRKAVDAMGRAVQQPIDRLDEHDEMVAAHLELSYDGDTVSHDKLHHGIEVQERTSKYLALVLVVAVAVALGALALAVSARAELGHARHQMHELRSRVERLEQAPPAPPRDP